jgi:hypothetical protein
VCCMLPSTERPNLSRWAHLAIGSGVVLSLLDQRFPILAGTGGRGAIPPSTLILPIVALLLIMRFGPSAFKSFATPAILAWMLYLLFGSLLPLIGVALAEFPERVAFGAVDVVVALSAVVIGGSAAVASAGRGLPWTRWLVAASIVQFGYSLAQILILAGVLSGEPWASLRGWDLVTQSRLGEIVLGRSTGLYVNPNVLGYSAAVLIVLGAHLPARMPRFVVVGSSVACLLLSESRGATFALLATVMVLGVRRAIAGRQIGRATVGLIVAGLAAVVVVLSVQQLGLTEASVFDRLAEGLAALAGRGTDEGLSGRVDLWAASLLLLDTRPFGTLGPPEMLLGSAIDSGWIRALVQGSVPYVAALALMLGAGFFLRGPTDDGLRLQSLSLLIALAAVSQLPLAYPPTILYWLVVGAVLARIRLAAVEASPPVLRLQPAVGPPAIQTPAP